MEIASATAKSKFPSDNRKQLLTPVLQHRQDPAGLTAENHRHIPAPTPD